MESACVLEYTINLYQARWAPARNPYLPLMNFLPFSVSVDDERVDAMVEVSARNLQQINRILYGETVEASFSESAARVPAGSVSHVNKLHRRHPMLLAKIFPGRKTVSSV